MKRLDLLRNASLGAVAAAAVTTGVIGCAKKKEEKKVEGPAAVTKKTYHWKMVTTWPPKLPVLQDGCERLARRIGELSDGRFNIQVFAGGELVPPLESFPAVSDGTVEVGSGASYYWAGKAYCDIIQPKFPLKG